VLPTERYIIKARKAAAVQLKVKPPRREKFDTTEEWWDACDAWKIDTAEAEATLAEADDLERETQLELLGLRLAYEAAAARLRCEQGRRDDAEAAAAALASEVTAQREAQESRERMAAAEARAAAADARAAEASRLASAELWRLHARLGGGSYGGESADATRHRLEQDAELIWGPNWRDR
jgi:hypothetical protein